MVWGQLCSVGGVFSLVGTKVWALSHCGITPKLG
nr:MAG TPA: hypothetical protein [Caudoviricetes sp.]